MMKVTLYLLIASFLCLSCSKKTDSQPFQEERTSSQANEVDVARKPVAKDSVRDIVAVEFAKVGELDEQPTPIRVIKPSYPSALFAENAEGSATLLFVVNQYGLVEDIQEQSYTHREFAQYAADALMHWRFSPPKKDGNPVKVKMRLEFPFVIDSALPTSDSPGSMPSSEGVQP